MCTKRIEYRVGAQHNMQNKFKLRIGQPKLTTSIALFVVVSIAISIAAVATAIYFQISANVMAQARDSQLANMRTTIAILETQMPGSDMVGMRMVKLRPLLHSGCRNCAPTIWSTQSVQ